jgi:hypothetical protein
MGSLVQYGNNYEYVNIGDCTQNLDPRSHHPTLYTNHNQPDVIALECYEYLMHRDNSNKGGIGLATLVSN